MKKEDKIENPNRRKFLLSGLLFILGVFCAYIYRGAASALFKGLYNRFIDKRPNIIMILMDTLRADHLGCYGYHRPISKNIDEFAKDGILYSETMAQSNWTLPSISSLFTSLFPHQHSACIPVKGNVMSTPLPDSFPTLAGILKDHGYHTMAVTGGAYVSAEANMDLGFQEFHEVSYKHDYEKGYLKNDLPHQLKKATELILDNYKKEKFFLFLHSYECHYPFIAPKKIVDILDPDYDDHALTEDMVSDLRHLANLGDNPTPEDLSRINALYDAEIMFSDDLLGLFFNMLKEIGIYDDTLIVFLSDHGVEFFEHKEWKHGRRNLFEEMVRVPVIFKYPKNKPKGINHDRLARLIDIMPTILIDILGIETKDLKMEGVPLSQDLKDEGSISEAMMSENNLGLFSVRSGKVKYIIDNDRNEARAFDLDEDPSESRNISDKYKEELGEAAIFARRAEEVFLENLGKSRSGEDVKITEEDFRLMMDLGYIE